MTKPKVPSTCAALKAERNAVLDAAIAKMAKGHWIEGEYHAVTDEGHYYCAIGALTAVKNSKKFSIKAVHLASEAIGTVIGASRKYDKDQGFPFGHEIVRFNDSKDTAKPVLGAFTKAKQVPLTIKKP